MAYKQVGEGTKIRLYVEYDLVADEMISLGARQVHYLKNVLRLMTGDQVALFNGRNGEWLARIDTIGKRQILLKLIEQSRQQIPEADIWLLFSPVKRTSNSYLVQKATELGVSALLPITTQRTAVDRVNLDRLGATAIEAAEQCRRLTVPAIRSVLSLDKILASWPPDRFLLFCDEAGASSPKTALARAKTGPWAILIGPEGGFDPKEREMLRRQSFVIPMCLGPRILRTETAAVAALSIWQVLAGDNQK